MTTPWNCTLRDIWPLRSMIRTRQKTTESLRQLWPRNCEFLTRRYGFWKCDDVEAAALLRVDGRWSLSNSACGSSAVGYRLEIRFLLATHHCFKHTANKPRNPAGHTRRCLKPVLITLMLAPSIVPPRLFSAIPCLRPASRDLYRGYIGIMENQMETTILYWGVYV